MGGRWKAKEGSVREENIRERELGGRQEGLLHLVESAHIITFLLDSSNSTQYVVLSQEHMVPTLTTPLKLQGPPSLNPINCILDPNGGI
jgi:hypothetical protein